MQEYFLKSYIETRAVEIANYIVENNATVRQAAKQFGISKSTVHKDITDADRLLRIDPELAAKAHQRFEKQKSQYRNQSSGSQRADRKSTRLNSSHNRESRMPSSA